MLLANLTSEGCLVKPRFPPGEENRFLVQFSTETGSHTLLAVDGRLDAVSSVSGRESDVGLVEQSQSLDAIYASVSWRTVILKSYYL